MSHEDTTSVGEILDSPRDRAHFLKGAAVAAAAVGLAPAVASAARLGSEGARSNGMKESPQTIINIAATAETAAVTALYHVHVAVNKGKLSTMGVAVPTKTLVSIVRAALREEQDHLSFLKGAGAKSLYHSFTFPEPIFKHATQTLKFFEEAETVFIAAYCAATREFAQGRMATLAQYTYQVGGTEAEHRTLMRAGLGQLPPNNKSFETNMYRKVGDAAKTLSSLGIFKPHLKYPGVAAVNRILASGPPVGVTQRKP